ncbi:CoA pyrophosphatase [Clostridium chauvoei]|uniref:NUDIX hydrolase n=1 Tax=Clostridium chauvoei TaxID=46867 RepID=UPI001C8646CB|nr:CoA pyrophosphatase [Clostridium chauvoei]MBX7331181.1 CoA pyrophosphatase [Clostridium chauvoei]
MIKEIRKKFKDFTPYINGWEEMRKAAVAIMIIEEDETEKIIFQVRAKNMKEQPGDISFPGGKIEKNETPKNAVIREIFEEIGLEKNDFEIVAPLDIFVTHYGLIIHLFLCYVKNIDKIKINKSEVDHLFSVPINFLINNKPLIFDNEITVNRNPNFPFHLINNGKKYKFKNGNYPSLFYIYNEYVIWGITAKILENFIKYLMKK